MANGSRAPGADVAGLDADRRTVLALLVAATASGAAPATRPARGATSDAGYDAGSYGAGPYASGSSEASLSVSTVGAREVTDSAATLDGELTDTGGAASVDVGFEIRASGGETWSATSTQTLSSPGAFDETTTALAADTEYEFRAVAAASDGDAATGSTQTFVTESAPVPPTIDQFDVSERGSPNPHAEISVDWQVSDADGDLDAVEIVLTDESGRQVDSATSSVSGASASGSESFRIKQGGGTTYGCTITVTDAASQSSSETERVSA